MLFRSIAKVFTTGYGEQIVKAALHADGSEVETFAHLCAAQEFCHNRGQDERTSGRIALCIEEMLGD